MVDNPLFPDDDQGDDDRPFQLQYEDIPPKGLPGSRRPVAMPQYDNDNNPAAELIRRKLEALYSEEPSTREEIKEVKREVQSPKGPFTSKHQEFMFNLSNSGKSLAEIQTAWHNYYLGLPEDEKLKVWEEFYENNGRTPQFFHKVASRVQSAREVSVVTQRPLSHRLRQPYRNPKVVVAEHVLAPPKRTSSKRVNRVRQEVIRRVSADGRLKAKHHLQSIAFGLALGLVAIVIFLFSFFNEVIIAPFIQPSRNVSSTPLILSDSNVALSQSPEIIIPKINVEIPVDYSQTSTDEDVIENALESGVVHYPTTVLPGQLGNAAFFGHSSNNIFNPGKYKFAFVLLHTLVPGDTFYLVYNNINYVYQVYQTKIVPPSDVSVLDNVSGKSATATLITCDPPGTSINRLVVWGLQISPDPISNSTAATTATSGPSPTVLPGNGPSLWSRFVHAIF